MLILWIVDHLSPIYRVLYAFSKGQSQIMRVQTEGTITSAHVPHDLHQGVLAPGYRAGLFLLFLVTSVVVTLVGQSALIPYQGRLAVKAGLSLVLLATTIGLYRSDRLRPFWKISLAYLAVSLGFLLAILVGRRLPDPDSLASSPMMGLALAKLFDVVPLILPMLLVPTLAGEDFGSIYLQRGKLGQSLLLGLLVSAATFVPFVMLGGLNAVRTVSAAVIVAALPWIAVFSLSNSFMEELWWRGLFLRKFQVFLGARGALWLTALGWGLGHLMVTYFAGGKLVAFVAVDILLGLAYGWITQRTDTLWGAVLAHAAADAFLVLGMLATLATFG